MNRAAIGHIAAGIIRAVTQTARIDQSDREKTILVTEVCNTTDWASLTFVGQRHRLAMRLEGEAATVASALAAIKAGLAEADIPLAGHFIADIGIVEAAPTTPLADGGVAQAFCVEALVLRD